MKIAHLVSAYPNLSETFVFNQITTQQKQGLNTHLIPLIYHSDSKQKFKIPNSRIHKLNLPVNKLKRIKLAIQLILPELVSSPLQVANLFDFFTYGKFPLNLKSVFTLRQKKLLSSIDILHCHFGWNGLIGSILKTTDYFNGKLVTTFYGSDVNVLPQKYQLSIYYGLFKNCNLILSNCKFLRNELSKLGYPRDCIKIHHMGVDCDKFQPPKNPDCSDANSLKMISIGRIIPSKGFQDVLRTLHKLEKNESLNDYNYKIIGDGKYLPKLKEMKKKYDLDSVEFVGRKPHEEIPDFLKQADILLAPSKTDQEGTKEGTPAVIMESMACGTPVIASDFAGIPEIIEHNKSGFLIETGNINELKQEILRCKNRPDFLDDIARNGRQKIENEFDISELTQRLYKIYENI